MLLLLTLLLLWIKWWTGFLDNRTDEAGGPPPVAHGAELEELEPAEREENASADERGRLTLDG
jgi:hypothetical protein